MPKRATVHDRADDVFFGLSDEPREKAVAPVPNPRPSSEETQSRRPSASPRASVSPTLSSDVPIIAALERLAIEAKIGAGFRFSEAELDELDDFVRDAKRLHGLRVKKQDVVRLALALLMEDYREKGESSQLIASMQARKLSR